MDTGYIDDYKHDDKTYQEAKSGFWGPNLPVVSDPVEYDALGREIVVVSDLHIATGRTPVGVFRGTENFFSDDAFGRFLDHIQSIKTTPTMLLVFNGDLFDFLRVLEYPGYTKKAPMNRRIRLAVRGYHSLPPQTPQPAAVQAEFNEWSAELSKVGIQKTPLILQQSISKQEKKYGLETDDYKTIYRLIRIRKGHPGFFLRLGRWLLDGNAILILKGNHDLELCQPKVREYIRVQLAEGMGGLSPDVRFFDDSVVIDGDFYLEHGHRYDKFTMVTGGPFLKGMTGQINIPFGSFFNRYLINRIELFYPYFDKVRPSGNIIPMLIRDNFPLALQVIFQQFPFVLRILSTNLKYVWFMIHRVVWIALIILIPVIALVWLDWDAIAALFTQKLPYKPKPQIDLGNLLGQAAKNTGALLVPYFVARIVSWFQLVEPDSLTEFASKRLSKPNCRFRIATMGHTHNPGEYTLNEGKVRFFNTGTWIPVIETSSASVREDRMYTFLHLQRDADGNLQVAEGGLLQRWNDDAGRAEPQLLIERK